MTSESAPSRSDFDDVREFIAAHEAFHDAHPPTALAILERAVRLGSDSLRGIALQIRRLRGNEPEDEEWWARVWLDFQFLIVALWRMRQSGILALSSHVDTERLQGALTHFDDQLPNLKLMRDVAQHFDEYAIDGVGRRHKRPGRKDKVGRRLLEVGSWNQEEVRWLGGAIVFESAIRASHELYSTVLTVRGNLRISTKAGS